jgi:hypothetical protein
MVTQINLPSEKVSSWYFSVHWAKLALENNIERNTAYGWPTEYDQQHVDRLQELETFLKAADTAWFDEIASTCLHAVGIGHES